MPKTNKTAKVLGLCVLCGKEIPAGSSFELINIGGKTKAACKGGCEK